MMMRNPAIDSYRGLGILLVIVAHVTFVPELLNQFLYSFGMTVFFMLSGFLFNAQKARRSPAWYIKEKFYRLVIPAWVIGMVCGIPYLFFVITGHIPREEFLTRLVGTLVGYPDRDYNFNCTPIWFLFCLFVLETIATLVVCRFERHYRAVFFAIGLVGLAVSITTDIFIPFEIDVALFAFFYFSLGSYLRDYDVFNIKLGFPHAVMCVLSFAVWAVMIYLSDDKFLIASNRIGTGWNILYNLVSSFCGTYVFYYVSRFLSASKGFSKSLSWLGVHTLPILGFNYMIDYVVFKLLTHYSLYAWELALVIQLMIFVPFVMLLDKTGLLGRVINGRVGPSKAKQPEVAEAR